MDPMKEQKPITEGLDISPSRTIKDSVFRDLFGTPEYLLELYRCIHPEDTTATEADLGNVTIRNVLTGDLYNDLGFTIRDRQLILVECQSTWSVNILARVLLYLAETWHAELTQTRQNIYGTKPIKLPKPEFYVLYTGDGQNRPEWLSLADTYFGGDRTYLELRVRMLYGDGSVNGILNQYVVFTEVLNEQIQIHGRTQKAIEETIRICEEKGALEKYLQSRKKEVIRIMTSLFSQENATRMYGLEQRAEGRAEGQMAEKKNTAIRMKAMGCDDGFIANVLNISLSKLQSWFSESPSSMPQA